MYKRKSRSYRVGKKSTFSKFTYFKKIDQPKCRYKTRGYPIITNHNMVVGTERRSLTITRKPPKPVRQILSRKQVLRKTSIVGVLYVYRYIQYP